MVRFFLVVVFGVFYSVDAGGARRRTRARVSAAFRTVDGLERICVVASQTFSRRSGSRSGQTRRGKRPGKTRASTRVDDENNNFRRRRADTSRHYY